MRYVVLGCGAIGGTVAAGLARDGHDVLVSDVDPEVVRAVTTAGLRIEGPVERFTAYPRAVLLGGLPERLDGPVLLAVKAHHIPDAAAVLAGRLHGGGFVVSLANGLPSPALAAAVGAGRVAGAVVNFGADVLEPGVVLRGNQATFLIGELDGRLTGRVASLAADIAGAQATTGILGHLWAKQAYGAMLFATAVSDLPIHAVFADPACRPLLTAVAGQVWTGSTRRTWRGHWTGWPSSTGARRRRIRGSTATWRCGTGRPRPPRSLARWRGACCAGSRS